MPIAQKGAISFALVYIPVNMYPATRDNDIHFNQLAKESKGRVRYKKIDEATGKELTSDDIVRAYQYDKGKYVVITDDDFEKIKTEKDRSVQILQFADKSEICPVYYNRTYYVIPQKGGEKPFELLRQAMLDKGKVAVGRTSLGASEVMLALIPADTGICMHTLHYQDDVKAMPQDIPQPAIDKEELSMAEKIIENMSKPFDPAQFQDEYQKRLRDLIESKIEGKEIALPKPAAQGEVISLMDALKASLEQNKPAKAPRRKQKAG
ncbi:MAG: Ku protein [Planctomycetes bacterium]|nr:Ku protein [Planctomycetota bacterium]